MKITTLCILSLGLLSACEVKSTEDTSSNDSNPMFEVNNLTVTSADCGDEEPPESTISVNVNPDSIVQVEHVNFTASSCLSFEVQADLDGNDVNLSYTEVGEPCDCISSYSLTYDIQGLETGIYRLQFPGNQSEDVTIE